MDELVLIGVKVHVPPPPGDAVGRPFWHTTTLSLEGRGGNTIFARWQPSPRPGYASARMLLATDAPSLPLVIGIPFLCMLIVIIGISIVWFVLGRVAR